MTAAAPVLAVTANPQVDQPAMRICYLSLDYPSTKGGGGVGTLVQTMARSLVSQGHSVSVVALADTASRERDGEIDVLRFAAGTFHRRLMRLPVLWSLARSMRELERSWGGWKAVQALHAERPFDLVEITETGGLFVTLLMRSAALVARLHGEGYTFYKHAPEMLVTRDVRWCRALQRRSLRGVRLLLSPSKAHAAEISGELGASHPPIEVVPNAVELSMLRIDSGERLMEAELAGKPVVLFVGRLDYTKGVPLLLRAARAIAATRPEVRFVLAGPSHHTLGRARVEAMIGDMGLHEQVRLLGHVPRAQLAAWYRLATVCVVPSYYETFGIAALEAMAFGRPVVASRAGALPELVEHQRTGLLIEPGNQDQLAAAIVQLIDDPALRERLSENGRTRVASLFEVDAVVRINVALYRVASALGVRQRSGS